MRRVELRLQSHSKEEIINYTPVFLFSISELLPYSSRLVHGPISSPYSPVQVSIEESSSAFQRLDERHKESNFFFFYKERKLG